MTTLAEAAAAYRAVGLHPVPCKPREKSPKVPWQEYQNEPPHADEVAAWWEQEPNANIALVLGRGVFAVDFDGPRAENLLIEQGIFLPENAPRVRTGRGQHVYLAANREIRNCTGLWSDGKGSAVDIRGDGGIVVAPPSIHPNGTVYEWIVGPTWPPPQAPSELIDILISAPPVGGADQPRVANWITTSLQGVGVGQRNHTCTRLAGYLLSSLPQDVVEAILADFGAKCSPPMPFHEIRQTVASVARAEARKLFQQQTAKTQSTRVEHIATVLDRVMDEMDADPSTRRIIPTPFPALNWFLDGGFRPDDAELVYVGARPSMGKSALATELLRHAAGRGFTSLFVSREMVNTALARRLLAQTGKLNASELRMGKVPFDQVGATVKRLRDLPVFMSDTAATLEDIAALLDEVGEVSFLLVDYLQLVRAPKGIDGRRLEIDAISAGLKEICKLRKIVTVCLSQLTRPPGAAINWKPTMASLKESGGLEADADIIVFLHRAEDSRSPDTELLVRKNREGKVGDIVLLFDRDTVSFGEKATNTDYDSSDATRWGR